MCGTGKRVCLCVCVWGGFGTAYSLPSLSRLTRTSEDRPSVSPRCSSGGWLQLPRPGISHFKRAFVPVPSGWVPHTVLPRGWRVCSERGCGARGWTGVLGLLVPCPLGLPPSASRCIGTYGGGRGREDGEGGLGRCHPHPPPAPGLARDWDGLCFPLAPGKVPGRPVSQPFLGSCQMVKGGGVPPQGGTEKGCVCVVCVLYVRVCVLCTCMRAL